MEKCGTRTDRYNAANIPKRTKFLIKYILNVQLKSHLGTNVPLYEMLLKPARECGMCTEPARVWGKGFDAIIEDYW
jgi:hypothetical protein